MFVRQLNNRFAHLFAGYKESENGVFNAENAARFLKNARRVRCKDYVYKVDLNHGESEIEETTTPNWFFILTNAAVYFDAPTTKAFPKVSIKFPDSVIDTTFGTDIRDAGAVPSAVVFGREGLGRFEEYKNLFYVMGERVTATVKVEPVTVDPYHGSVLLTGVEIDLSGVYNG